MSPHTPDPLDPHARRVGTTLQGKWTLNAFLGLGGAGAVYGATHRNGKRVAVKILHRELSTSPELVARFVREGYVANRIQHAGVVSVLDDDVTADGLHFMVMDLLEGMTLDALLKARGGTLLLGEALAVIDEVLDVLAAAHAQGIIHRDIKPANIFVLHDASVRVLDFGIARFHESAGNVSLTQAGGIMGSPGYMPSEQARGHVDRIDARTDVWSVGATLYTMLSGARLHDAATANESLLQAMVEPVAPMATLRPDLPTDVGALLDRALAFQQDGRFADAKSMQDEVRKARSRQAGSVPRVERGVPELPETTRVDGTSGSSPLRSGRPSFPAETALVPSVAPSSSSSQPPTRGPMASGTVLVPVVPTTGSLSPSVAAGRPAPAPRRGSNLRWLAGFAAAWITLVGAGWALFSGDESTTHRRSGAEPPARALAREAPPPPESLAPPTALPLPPQPLLAPPPASGNKAPGPTATVPALRVRPQMPAEPLPAARGGATTLPSPPRPAPTPRPEADPLGGRF